MRVWRAVAWTLVVTCLGACRALADLRDLQYVPVSSACNPPTLPTAGSARVRLVNAGTTGRSDFCVRPSGSTDWGQPVLHDPNASCPSGLDYAQATIPFAMPAGAVDVEAIPAGATCDAAATSQLASVAVTDTTIDEGGVGGPVVTLVRFGGSAGERIVALPEEPASMSTVVKERFRLVNALSSGESINFGLTGGDSAPLTVAVSTLPSGLPPGSAPPPSGPLVPFGPIDSSGYVVTEPLAIPVGVVLEGRQDALFTVSTAKQSDTQTLFALGDSSDPLHPVKGLFCEDVPPVGAPDDAGTEEDSGGDAGGGAPAPFLATCQPTEPPALAVDTFNVSLYGANAPYESDRRRPLQAAIAARTTDLMCLLEVESDADKTAIAQAASAHFKYSYFAATDLTTPFDDPAEADGTIPPAPTAPPCGSLTDEANAAIGCMEQSCASPPGATGALLPTGCLTNQCASQLGALRYGTDPASQVCFDCLIYYGVSELPLAHDQQQCTTVATPPFAFDGMTPLMILSRYPLANTRAYILPATGFRRAVLYAQVQLEDQSVDFYCAQLSSPYIDSELPYTGNYGVDGAKQPLPDGGQTSGNGWEDEQSVQVEQVISFVQKTSGSRPAIVAGDWHASVAASVAGADGGTVQVVADNSPEVLRALDQSLGGAFVRAEPAGYQPVCQYCPAPANPYNIGTVAADLTATFLSGIPKSSTIEDSIWGTDPTVVPLTPNPYETYPSTGTGPIAEFYPRLVRILRPKAP